MYDSIDLAYTLILEYNLKLKQMPTNFILQRLLHLCQIEYMRQHDGKLLFKDELLCSSGGPLIERLSKHFIQYNITPIYITESKLRERRISEPQIVGLIQIVLNSLSQEVLTNSLKLSEHIMHNRVGAWWLQKEEDQDVRRQPIRSEYLRREAGIKKNNNIQVALTIIDEFHKKLGVYPRHWALHHLVYHCELEYMRNHHFERLYDEDYFPSSARCLYQKTLTDLFEPFVSDPIRIPDNDLEAYKTKDVELVSIVKKVLNSFSSKFLTEFGVWHDEIIKHPSSAWVLHQKECAQQNNIFRKKPVKLKYIQMEAGINKNNNIEIAYTIIDEFHKKLRIYPCPQTVHLLVYYCELAYMKRYSIERLYDENYFMDKSCIYQKTLRNLFLPYGKNPIVLPDYVLSKLRSDNEEIVRIVKSVLDSIPTELLMDPEAWSSEVKNNPTSAWHLQMEEMKQKCYCPEQVPVKLKYLKKEIESK